MNDLNIKNIRKYLKITRQEMSKKLEIPYSTIDDWEHERRTPPKYVEKLIIEKLLSLYKKKNDD